MYCFCFVLIHLGLWNICKIPANNDFISIWYSQFISISYWNNLFLFFIYMWQVIATFFLMYTFERCVYMSHKIRISLKACEYKTEEMQQNHGTVLPQLDTTFFHKQIVLNRLHAHKPIQSRVVFYNIPEIWGCKTYY